MILHCHKFCLERESKNGAFILGTCPVCHRVWHPLKQFRSVGVFTLIEKEEVRRICQTWWNNALWQVREDCCGSRSSLGVCVTCVVSPFQARLRSVMRKREAIRPSAWRITIYPFLYRQHMCANTQVRINQTRWVYDTLVTASITMTSPQVGIVRWDWEQGCQLTVATKGSCRCYFTHQQHDVRESFS